MFKFLLISAFFGVIAAESAKFIPCDGSPPCSISEVRIDPCTHPDQCKLKKGNTYSLSYDFKPDFSADKAKTGLFWAKTDTEDVPFPEMYNADACQYTACPIVANKLQTFDYSLRLSKKLPSGQYVFKLKLWDENDDSKNCCFKTNIELRRK
ncbi:MD-2-related lipid-recognition protein-like [Pieris napi]|uniref:MD-2-related lipid-recognition protein-like n=1 Tax=Pieris napi TaxID=78633 RepID=UPI001FBA8CE5|nr:MD-2-related lipid-recognition protein-like [Pieris napi]